MNSSTAGLPQFSSAIEAALLKGANNFSIWLAVRETKHMPRPAFAGNAPRWLTVETPSRIYRCRALPVSAFESCETTRKPLLLFQLSGVFLLRLAQRTLRASFSKPPPRNRASPLCLLRS